MPGATAAATAQAALQALQALQPRLQARLHGLVPALQLEVAASLGSTNTALLQAARQQPAGQPPLPRLLVALEQTAGRGRLGRRWQAAPGDSLTFSLALPLEPRSWSGLSLAVGLALAEALEPLQAPEPPASAGAHDGAAAALPPTPRLLLKWPNDLWLLDAPGQGRKLGGVLIETVQAGAQRVCVIGVGLNIAPRPAQGLDTAPAWLREIDPDCTVASSLDRCAEPLLRAVLRFADQGFAPLVADYARRDLLRGQALQTLPAAGGPALQAGLGAGVDDDGALCLLAADGQTLRVLSGEVSVRLQATAAPGAQPEPAAQAGQPAEAGPC